MSTYNGRKAPNVSQYLRDLNHVSPPDHAGDDGFNVGDDIFNFTNTQFFDLDSGQNTDFQAPPSKPDVVATPVPSSAEEPGSVMGDISNMDFMNGDFTFPDFNAYQPPSLTAFADASHNFQPLQPSQGAVFPNQVPPGPQPSPFAQSNAIAKTGEKRKADASTAASTPQGNLEDLSRQAAEDDKRRRNTAASARFRVKKKQREQALEKSAKEMTEKVTTLESRVSQLETENKWLKNLLVEKNEGSEDITSLWKEFTKQAGKRGKAELAKDDR